MIPICDKCGKKYRIVSAKANEPIYLTCGCKAKPPGNRRCLKKKPRGKRG